MTVAILFTQHEATRTAEAHHCYRQLFHGGREIGVAPYRIGVKATTLITEPPAYWRTVSALKQAIDPHQIIRTGPSGFCSPRRSRERTWPLLAEFKALHRPT